MEVNDSVTIKKTRNGRGLIAQKHFYPGETVYEVKGKLFKTSVIDSKNGPEADNCFRFSKEMYINPAGEIGNYQNHSCAPNCIAQKIGDKLLIIALNDIEKNEEVLIDFSTIVATDDPWKMKCNCGEINCRKNIDNFQSLPKNLQEKYRKIKAVPDYIDAFSITT